MRLPSGPGKDRQAGEQQADLQVSVVARDQSGALPFSPDFVHLQHHPPVVAPCLAAAGEDLALSALYGFARAADLDPLPQAPRYDGAHTLDVDRARVGIHDNLVTPRSTAE